MSAVNAVAEANKAHSSADHINPTIAEASDTIDQIVGGAQETASTLHPLLINIEIFVNLVESLGEVNNLSPYQECQYAYVLLIILGSPLCKGGSYYHHSTREGKSSTHVLSRLD